jgi:hypothetical protein
MDSNTGILLGKIAFYVALIGLVAVLIIKKKKQSRDIHRDDIDNINKPKP